MAAPVPLRPLGSGYLLWLRDAAGSVSASSVVATGRLGPAGHVVYSDCDGHLQVEITADGRHRVLTRPARTHVVATEPLP
ncbi:DUF6296 family protein [Kitasatospora sp. NPDC090091]|uniref:DUF6296 family protein n=1 Tax=Kitasatospora sp. NPDC090091 TaxID=3364081 RepID=UPI003802094E